MTKVEGIKVNESIVHSIRCTYQELLGDLVLTDNGISFLEIRGMLGQSREQLHRFDFDKIRRIRTKRKIAGIFRHGIVIDHQSEFLEKQSYYFSCEEYKAVLFLAFLERQKLLVKTPQEISSTIQSLSMIKRNADLFTVAKNPKMRPYFFAFALGKLETEILNLLRDRFDIDLLELSLSKQTHSLVALLHESDSRKITKDKVFHTVTDLTTHLISRGELDGIVTEFGRYVSNRALARITIPLDMVADFETLFTQLNENGLIIWALECPTCFKKMKYPEKGKETTCEFCKETIHAIDVFKKFLGLL